MKKLFRENLLKAKVVISTEDTLPYKEPDVVNTDPDAPLQPDNVIVTSPEVIDTIEDEIAAIEVDLIAIESLSSIPSVLAQHQNHADQEKAFLVTLESTLLDPQAARRILSTTVTGGISCSADIISLEETTGNAARSHWDSLINKINKLASANVGLVDDSESVGSGILEKMKGLKKQVQAYKGGRTVSVGRIAGSYKLDDLVRNTQAAIQEDIGMKLSFPLDSAVDELARMAAKAISSSASDGLAQIAAKGAKQAEQMATQYKVRDPELPILGYRRKTTDSQVTLPQGIISALAGNDGKYNYPRYVGLKGSTNAVVELTPQQAKQLYDIGMYIGREIAEQSRVWEFRLGTLKALLGLAKTESRNVDADRNTWAAEQKAATSVVRMWSTNAAARRHYVATYNKVAYQIYELLTAATSSNVEPSQEFMGLFGGKKKSLSKAEAIAYVKSNMSNIGTASTNYSLLGEDSDPKNIDKSVTNTIRLSEGLIKTAVGPYEKAYLLTDKFNNDDIDEDELEDGTESALQPFMRFVGKGQTVNNYRIWVTQSGSGIEGEFKSPIAVHPLPAIVGDAAFVTKLLNHAEKMEVVINSLKSVKFLEYSQHHYEWVDPLKEMLTGTQKQLIEMCLAFVGSNIQVSQELLGGLFGKKPQTPKLTPEEKIKYIRENIDKVVSPGDSGLKLVVGDGVTTNNIYELLANELPTFNNNAKPAMVKRLYSALNSAIKYTEGKPTLNREEPWVDLQSDIINKGTFKPERILEDMTLRGDRWVTMHKVLVNLVWSPKRISMDWTNGNNHVAVPLADAATLKKLFPLVERMWREVDADVTGSDALKFNVDLWGSDHFAETICVGYGNYIRGNEDILHILIDVFYKSIQPPVDPQVSQEFFGPFKKKPKEEPKVEVKPRTPYINPKALLTQLPKTKIDPSVSHNLVAYSNSFPEHVKLLTKAAAEVNAKFNIANIRKFGVELNKLADQVMETFKYGDPDDDWKAEGNKALQMLLTEVEEQRLWGRFFGVDNIGGVFETSFKTAPNVRWDNKESTERIPNANLGKQSVSGVDLTSATQLCKLAIAFPDPGEVNGVAQNNKFLKSFPKFDDAMYYHFEEPIQDVLMQLDDIIGNSYDLLLLAAVTDPGDHEFR